jgi:hypothetical protein
MSDFLHDTPVVTRLYCPICEPDTDPTQGLLEMRYCDPHAPVRDGTVDGQVQALSYMSGSGEAGGDDNRAWCELFHRKARLLTGGSR